MLVVIVGVILVIMVIVISRSIMKYNERERDLNEVDNFEELSETISRNIELVDRQDTLVDKQINLKEKIKNVETKLGD